MGRVCKQRHRKVIRNGYVIGLVFWESLLLLDNDIYSVRFLKISGDFV